MNRPTNILDHTGDAALRFDALLHPHRSLGARGFLVLMLAVAVVSFVIGLVFYVVGAWPVLGFFGLDVALIYFAFRLNYRAGREHETVQLSENLLRVRHVSPSGHEQRWDFSPYWVRISCDDEPDGAVWISSHGRALGLGRFLTSDERHDFARELEAAIVRLRDERHEAAAI